MKLSICCITYNHEKYIRKALNSFIRQKTNFEFEIVIGEDCSTDRTRIFCEKFEKLFPGKVRLLPQTANLGMMPNFLRTLGECKGEYIAFCEGDDYWTDLNKLQMQVDFLDDNPDFSLCFHDVLFKSGNRLRRGFHWDAPDVSDLQYILRKGCFISTLSAVCRNNTEILTFLKSFDKAPLGDYFLFISAAMFGKVKRLRKVMGVYRSHEGGTWSQLSFNNSFNKALLAFNALFDKMDDKYRDDLAINFLGMLTIAVRVDGPDSIINNEFVDKLIHKLSLPLYVKEFIIFSAEERKKVSFYSQSVSFSLLAGGLKEKIINHLPKFSY